MYYKGRITKREDGTPETIKEYSDPLAMFMLKGNRERYKDGQHIIAGPQSITLTVVTKPNREIQAGPVELKKIDYSESE